MQHSNQEIHHEDTDMPCDMYKGATAGDFAENKASQNARRLKNLEDRMSRIDGNSKEAASLLCAACRAFPDIVPRVRGLTEWWQEHKDLDERAL